jgi:hypothetical protein
MDKYNKIKECCSEYGCSLLTTFEEFEIKRETVLHKSCSYVRIDFIGICGHNSSAVVTNFMTRKTGIRCKDCVKQNQCDKLKLKNRETSEIELNGVKIIEKYLSDKYDIIRTKEGCKADLVIQKKGDIDKYIPVQLKCTEQISHKMYSFRGINKEYDNMLIVCICISETKIWLFPYNDIKHLSSLNISSRSKYNKYFIEDNAKFSDSIEKMCDPYYASNLEELMTPRTELQAREQEYVQKREKYIKFLNYAYPDIQNTPTDFIANGKKVQEKVAGICKTRKGNNILSTCLASNNGKKDNGVRKHRTYRLGENDFYWFHSSIDQRFWIIPELVLYNRGSISAANETKNNKALQIREGTKWLKEYQYSYDDVDASKNKIIALFS